MSARLVFVSGAVSGSDVPLEGERVCIGREADQDFVMPVADAEYVSRAHALLTYEDGRWWVEDQGSTNGTHVNGQKISKVRLRQGDVIQFGRHGPEARFDDGSTMVAPSAARPGATAGAASGAPSGESEPRQQPARAASSNGGGNRATWALGLAAVVAVLALGLVVFRDTWANPERAFNRIADDIQSSVFLVETGIQYGGDQYIPLGNGSAFAADDDGLIITNKHVVFPEQYSLRPACLFALLKEAGANPVRVVTVWPGGTRFKASPADRLGDRGLGYSSENGELEIAATGTVSLGREQHRTCEINDNRFQIPWAQDVGSNNDIVVLRVASHLHAIPLAEEEPAEGDPIMVVGFPAGLMTQEGVDALPIDRRGEVLRVQETIQHGAPAMGGNSGGPVVNRHGEVVGIHSAGIENTHKFAIKIDFARRVLERARMGKVNADDGS